MAIIRHSKRFVLGSSPSIHANYGEIAQQVERDKNRILIKIQTANKTGLENPKL